MIRHCIGLFGFCFCHGCYIWLQLWCWVNPVSSVWNWTWWMFLCWTGRSNTEMAKQLLKLTCSFCTLWAVGLGASAKAYRCWSPLKVHALHLIFNSELFRSWVGFSVKRNDVNSSPTWFSPHCKYTKPFCQLCVYSATGLQGVNSSKEFPSKFSGRIYLSCESSWVLNATSDWQLLLSPLSAS